MYIENSTIKKQFSIWLLTMLLIISIIIIVGGLTRLTDSGLSITKWDLFKGFIPPMNSLDWDIYFNYRQRFVALRANCIPSEKLEVYIEELQ